MVDPKIIEKIQKLINLKEGAEAVGSMHEAENAAARLQEFLFKYNLDLDTVKKSKIEAKAEMDKVSFDVSGQQDKREANWIPDLYQAIGKNFLCEVRVSNTYVWVLGHKNNVSIVLYIAEQMVAKVRIACKEAFKQYEGPELFGTFRRGFLKGCSQGIMAKLERQKWDMQQGNNPMALMIVTKEKELEDYLIEGGWKNKPKTQTEIELQQAENERWWNSLSEKEKKAHDKRWEKQFSKKGPRTTTSKDGYSVGYEAGTKMKINKGLEESGPTQNIH